MTLARGRNSLSGDPLTCMNRRPAAMNRPFALLLAAITFAATPACNAQKSPYPDYAVPRLEGVTVPGLPAVTGRIALDQFGYLPASAKVAVITNPVRGYNV